MVLRQPYDAVYPVEEMGAKYGLCYIRQTMARRFLYILLAVMTFQLSWSVAADYCAHEVGRAANHFGHHEHHANKDELSLVAKQKSKQVKAFAVHDAHCASHLHLTLAAPDLIESPPLVDNGGNAVADMAVCPTSVFLSPPERPQWTGHA